LIILKLTSISRTRKRKKDFKVLLFCFFFFLKMNGKILHFKKKIATLNYNINLQIITQRRPQTPVSPKTIVLTAFTKWKNVFSPCFCLTRIMYMKRSFINSSERYRSKIVVKYRKNSWKSELHSWKWLKRFIKVKKSEGTLTRMEWLSVMRLPNRVEKSLRPISSL